MVSGRQTLFIVLNNLLLPIFICLIGISSSWDTPIITEAIKEVDVGIRRTLATQDHPGSVAINTSLDIDSTNGLPVEVLRTAVRPSNGSNSLTYSFESNSPTDQYFVTLHFAEIEGVAQNLLREFSIFMNGFKSKPIRLEYLKSLSLSFQNLTIQGGVNFTLVATKDSDLPPILNAFNIYKIRQFSLSPTNQSDGEISSSFSDLQALEFLNLSGNKFTGSIPQSLKDKSNYGSLVLSFADNPDLCQMDPCPLHHEGKTSNVPVVASIAASVIVLIVLSILLVFCMIRRRRKGETLTRTTQRMQSDMTTSGNPSEMSLLNLDSDMVPIARGGYAQESTRLVPAIMSFGDSGTDVGNNNYLPTIFKANYPPYGRDFANQKPTGRFCNGKLATDITAETLGFTTYPPAYLSPEASGKNLLIGANFASAGSGYDDKAASINHAITLTQQVEYFKEYKGKLAKVAGSNKSASIIKDSIYLLSAGTADFLQNYYVNPLLNHLYTPDQYSSMLIDSFKTFVKNIYGLGARKIGVTSLLPLGCTPLARTLFGYHKKECVAQFNTDSQQFNKKLNSAAASLQKRYPDLKIVIFDIFKPLYDVVKSPSNYGFVEATRGCCGTGKVETTWFLCNPKSSGTCPNATQYVFWDSVHPSQAANQVLADALIVQGIALI
ncbi:Lipase, GDSL [Corchorus capsularis]|uniref:Lipase, GDSL n=1 Tax=Corchorus capsularis TaxID=210143 RepID=A0A1R3HKM1_COCAP|nr:Lipase, GDSL [Corchorus capsularis]